MKRLLASFGITALIAIGITAPAFAQQGPGTFVTATGQRGDAAARCDGTTSGTQATLTLATPAAGARNYITMLYVFGEASGVPTAATPTMATMTGVSGTTPSLLPLASVYPAAGAQGSVSGGFVPLATPIKCLLETACAIVGPTAITNMTQAIGACYYAAP